MHLVAFIHLSVWILGDIKPICGEKKKKVGKGLKEVLYDFHIIQPIVRKILNKLAKLFVWLFKPVGPKAD